MSTSLIKSQIPRTSTRVKRNKGPSDLPTNAPHPKKVKSIASDEDDDFVSPEATKKKKKTTVEKATKVIESTPENTDDDDFLPEPKVQKKNTKVVKSKKSKNESLVACVENSPYEQEYNSMQQNTKEDMKIGGHLSIADGIDKVPAMAVSIGAKAFAIFTGSQRQWNRKLPSSSACTAFKSECVKNKFEPKHILPHGSYLINLGSPEEDKLAKSRELFLLEMKSCQMLGLSLYNFHPGSHKSIITEDECLARIAESINIVHTQTEGVTAVLEVTAGAGFQVGQRFEHIKKIIEGVTDKTRVGVCIDTCHVYAAGYDISSEKGYMSVMAKFDEVVGLKYLKGMHINDSKAGLGSKADRHENIGKGELGKTCFERIVNDPHLKDIPMILETAGPYDEEIKLLYSMLKQH